MNLEEATIVAARYLLLNIQPHGCEYSIVMSGVIEESDGWYFPYQTKKYIESGDINDSVVGNWPVFVAKDGRVGLRMFGMPFLP